MDIRPEWIKNLLLKVGIKDEFQLIALPGGKNNRGFRVQAGRNSLFLKAYFHHPSDHRDRLKTEFNFCEFLWRAGVQTVPQPLAKDRKRHLGLYKYVDGRPLTARDVTRSRVGEATDFFLELNRLRLRPSAKKLSAASEASFSIGGHLNVLEGRVKSLMRIRNESRWHREAITFVEKKLVPEWQRVAFGVEQGAAKLGLSLEKQLPIKDRSLSPSDFGFHNAILTPQRKLCFVDFEYAGWDDLAKAVSDFALQPRIPFPMELLPIFYKPIMKYFKNEKFHRARLNLLFPVFALKWCCIVLNDFLQAKRQPRQFALGLENRDERLARQLEKATKYVRRSNQSEPLF